MGCLPQRKADSIRKVYPEIDLIVGSSMIGEIPELIERKGFFANKRRAFLYSHDTPRNLLTPGHYAYLKIAEGCSRKCTFCTIPAIKGPMRSRPLESIIAEARRLVQKGVRELILIAQDITMYGVDLYGKPALTELLWKLDALPGDFWIRLLYLHPAGINRRLTGALKAMDKAVPYLDVPLQHISDRLLRLMGRAGGGKKVRWVVEKLRSDLPDFYLRTEIIVGFPGESENEFQELLKFMEEVSFERIGLFRYWDELGTPSSRMEEKVPEETIEDRYAIAHEISNLVMERAQERLIGKTLRAIADESGSMGTFLRTLYDAPDIDMGVRVGEKLEPGRFYEVEVTEREGLNLAGKVKRGGEGK